MNKVKVMREEPRPGKVFYWVYMRVWFIWEPVDVFSKADEAVAYARNLAAGPVPDKQVWP